MQRILVLAILSFCLLAACSEQPSTGRPNADHIVKFNKDGLATVRGNYRSAGFHTGGTASGGETLDIVIPVKVEGLETGVSIPLVFHNDTKILSSLMSSSTTVSNYHIYHPTSHTIDAFPRGSYLEVTFMKKDTKFEIVSIQDVAQPSSFFRRLPSIEHVFSTDAFSQGTLEGDFTQSMNHNDGTISWTTSVPVEIHEVEAAVILMIDSTPATQVNTANGVVSADSGFSWGDRVQIQFTRQGDRLIAGQITVIR